MNRLLSMALCAALLLLPLSACSEGGQMTLANELIFPLDEVRDLTISYDEEDITFQMGAGDFLVVREYMTVDRESCHARVSQSEDSLRISEGGKPLFSSGFSRRVEVELPASYRGALTVTTTNGAIDLSDTELELSSLRVDSSAGTVLLNCASAPDIRLSSTHGTLELGRLVGANVRLESAHGDILCDRLEGQADCVIKEGSLTIRDLCGGGSLQAENGGRLDVTCTQADGDLELFSKNGDVSLSLPAELAFYFRGETKNGAITTDFSPFLTGDASSVSGAVGGPPSVSVRVETKNGNILVHRGGEPSE